MIIVYKEQKQQMEDENKEQYFRYYQCRTPTTECGSRKKQQFKRNNHTKLLPHITQEYNYRITNYLLIKKIMSPKRDKTIMQSLEGLSRKYHSAHSNPNSVSREKFRTKGKLRTFENCRSQYAGSSVQHSQKEQSRAKTALRQGKIARRTLSKNKAEVKFSQENAIRVNEVHQDLNQSDKLQDRTYTTMFSKDTQSNQVVMGTSFNKKWKENYPLHGHCFKNHSAGYGNGPTILLLTHLEIDTNPAIKPETLIQLQLIERASFSSSYFNVTYKNSQKTVKTDPFKYSELPKENDAASSVKFCIRPCKIGDFVPLRIWKYCGVQSILVGTIDLPLNAYGDDENDQAKKKVQLVQKKDNDLLYRKVFHGQVQHNLAKNKMFETDSVALVKYKVYPKRFQRRQDKILIKD